MKIKTHQARFFIRGFLWISILTVASLISIKIYQENLLSTSSEMNSRLAKALWHIRLLLLLPMWLIITQRRLKKRSIVGLIQCGITFVLLVPGIYIIMKLFFLEEEISIYHYIFLSLSAITSLFLFYNLRVIFRNEDHHLKLGHYLFILFVTFSFMMVNFYFE